VPALISDKVNIWREIVSDGGGLVAEDTLDGTCKLLSSYLQIPEQERLAMRLRARRCFEHRFEITKAAKNLESVLSRISCAHLRDTSYELDQARF